MQGLLLGCLTLWQAASPSMSWASGMPTPGSSQRYCDEGAPRSAAQQDRLLRMAALVRRELDAAAVDVALVSRNGTNLHRLGLRYSHAGLSLRDNGLGPWSVRQLYYACDERRPRLYDQGLAGFLSGTDNPDRVFLSVVMLPRDDGLTLARTALDGTQAQRLVNATYSANAYAFSVRYQNCNQWVAELMATAWGGASSVAPAMVANPSTADGPAPTTDTSMARAKAQAWLAAQGYVPEAVNVGSHWLMAAAPFIGMIHTDDHPQDDLQQLRMRTSLPTSLEAFVRTRMPDAERVELCHDTRRIVLRRGWKPLDDACTPQAGDEVMALD